MAPLPAERDLVVGLVVAVVLHAAVAVWGAHAVRAPRPIPPSPRQLVHTVREAVALPKPPPPPAKLEPPPPEPPKPAAAAPQPRAPRPVARAPQPGAKTPTAAAAGPQPFALSQTYGGAGDGVVVQTAPDDVFGNPEVDADEKNVRRRPIEEPVAAPPPLPAESAARQVEIVSALPRPACRHVQWPEGAETGNRVIEVVLGLDIGPDGGVRRVRILRGGGEPFDDSAVAHVKSCGWEPGRRDGQPFTDHVSFVVEFRPSGG
ncbi:MAG: energy transducer TonB [Myxococcales bacterium]|nr:energy transducer TonB [Myxococcales bacterium]